MTDPKETGADTAPGAPAEGPQGAPGTPAIDKGDFDARLENEPRFAAAEYKKVQGKLSQAQAELARTADLKAVMETLGSGSVEAGKQALLQHLNAYGQVRGNPQMSRIIDRFLQTGTPPPLDPLSDDPALEPPSPQQQQIEKLERELADLRGESGQQKLLGLLDGFFEKYPLNDEEKARVLAFAETTARTWAATEQGRQALRNMNPKTLKSLLLAELDETDTLERAVERRIVERNRQRQATATDERPATRTTGREASEYKNVHEAFAAFRRKEGLPPNGPLT